MEGQSEAVGRESTGFICPECGKADIPNKRILGIHRWSQHGVKGETRRVDKPEEEKTVRHYKKAKQIESDEVIQQKAIAPVKTIIQISPELVGYTLGKIESLAEQIAHDNEILNTREFVGKVMEYYAMLAKR